MVVVHYLDDGVWQRTCSEKNGSALLVNLGLLCGDSLKSVVERYFALFTGKQRLIRVEGNTKAGKIRFS